MTPRQLANAVWAVGKLKARDSLGPLGSLGSLTSRVAIVVTELDVSDFANLVWAYGTLRVSDADAGLFRRMQSLLHQFSVQELVSTTWGIGALQAGDASLTSLAALQLAVNDSLLQFSLQQLASVAWSLGKLSAAAALPDVCTFSRRLLKNAKYSPQDLANLAWAMAKAKQVDEKLFEMILQKAVSRIPEFKVMEISSIAWAFASVRASAEPMMSAICEVLPELRRSRSLPGLLWAFAAMAWSYPAEALAETARAILSTNLNPQSIAATVWSIARLKLNLPLNVPLASVKHFGSQELSNTGWGLATLMLTNHELLGAIEERQWMVLNASKPQELASIS